MMELQTCIATVEISMNIPQEAGNTSSSRSLCNTLGYILKECFILLQRQLLNSVHFSVIHNSHELETTSLSFNRGMDKENVMHLHNEALLSFNNEIMSFTG